MKKDSPDEDKGENGDFCRLLHKIQTGLEPIDALFDDQVFKTRLRLMIAGHRQKPEDADELTNDIRFKIWRSLATFTPNYEFAYGNFFAWLRRIIRNSYFDTLKDVVQFSAQPSEDSCSETADLSVDIERDLLFRERVIELESCIAALPERERMAATLYVLEGLSCRETADQLTLAGFPCTQVTALKWVKNALKPYFPQAIAFSIEELARKSGKLARERAGQETSSSDQDRQEKLAKRRAQKVKA